MAYWVQLWLTEYKNQHIEHKIICRNLLNIATKLLATTINNQKSVSTIMIRSREINLHSFVLMNWFPIQNGYVQLIFATTMQCWKRKISWRAFKSIHFEYAREEWFLIRQIHDNQWNLESCCHSFAICWRNKTVIIAVHQSIILSWVIVDLPMSSWTSIYTDGFYQRTSMALKNFLVLIYKQEFNAEFAILLPSQ